MAFTSDVTITATDEATPTTIVTSNSIALDGSTTVIVEFYCPWWETPSNGDLSAMVLLYDALDGGAAASIGRIGHVRASASGSSGAVVYTAVTFRARITPASGDHVFSICAYADFGNSTGVARAGAGGSGTLVPGYIRVVAA